jgi:hypothetical protein
MPGHIEAVLVLPAARVQRPIKTLCWCFLYFGSYLHIPVHFTGTGDAAVFKATLLGLENLYQQPYGSFNSRFSKLTMVEAGVSQTFSGHAVYSTD